MAPTVVQKWKVDKEKLMKWKRQQGYKKPMQVKLNDDMIPVIVVGGQDDLTSFKQTRFP